MGSVFYRLEILHCVQNDKWFEEKILKQVQDDDYT